MTAKTRKPKITITPSARWATHASGMIMLYGDCYVDWYKEEGLKLFFDWAEKQEIKFVEAK